MALCICGKSGKYKFPLSMQYFCPECFKVRFEKKFLKKIPRKIRGHSIAIAFSGGKDSSTLLGLFNKFRQKLRIHTLKAISLDDEMPEIQKERSRIVNIAKKRYPDVQFNLVSFSDLFGYSLPILVKNSDNKNLRFTPCTICGVLRRHALIRIALDLKVDYIAMGNTLNDEAATTILNILRGNPEKNLRDVISYRALDTKSLPIRIKPISKFFEKTIGIYCNINHIPRVETICTYANRSLRSDINSFLNKLENSNPVLLSNI
ncbi:MAG: ATP-binding protein, partial [Candidatus Hodarchaeales archaeon]